MIFPAFIFLTGVLAATPAHAAEMTVTDIVDRANKVMRGESSRGRMEMTVVTPNWKRTLDIEGWNQGREKALIVVHSPAKDRGNATLRRKNKLWVWLPKVEKVMTIPPTMMQSSWQGSDFTYEDIVKADSIVKDYTHKILKREPKGEAESVLIQADPKPDAAVVWGKVLLCQWRR